MMLVLILAVRVAIAAFYLTLAVAAPERAKDVALEYAVLVFLVAAADIVRWRHAQR
jgi:hypothetical protein